MANCIGPYMDLSFLKSPGKMYVASITWMNFRYLNFSSYFFIYFFLVDSWFNGAFLFFEQTDTCLAIEAKHMRRWEFDSISQAAKGITSWFLGIPSECSLLKQQLNCWFSKRLMWRSRWSYWIHGRITYISF